MEFLKTYAKEFVALMVPLVTWFLNSKFKPRARLVWSTNHAFNFLIQEPRRNAAGEVISSTQMVRTASITLNNSGKDAAKNLEVVFNFKPAYMNVWPLRPFGEHLSEDGRYTVRLSSLAPEEFLSFELLSINDDLPALANVRSDQCTAKQIQTIPIPSIPVWKHRLAVFLILAGLAAVVYVVIIGIQFLVLHTPFGTPT